MTVFLGGLFLALTLQAFLSYRQLGAVYKTLAQVKREHAGSGYLAMGSAKSKLPFCVGVAFILVVNEAGVVVDCREMQGRTVFAAFRRRVELDGLTMEAAAARMTGKVRLAAFQKAIQLISDQRGRQAVPS